MKKLDKTLLIYAGYILAAVAVIAFVLGVWLNSSAVLSFLMTVIRVFSPVFYAFLVFLIVYPVFLYFRDKVFLFLAKKKQNVKLRKTLSVISSYLVYLLLVAAAFVIILVPLAGNISDLQTQIPSFVRSAINFVDNALSGIPFLADSKDNIISYIRDTLTISVDSVQVLLPEVLSVSEVVFSEAASILVGIIISIYLITSVEYLEGLRDKLFAAYLQPAVIAEIHRIANYIYTSFAYFITGRLMHSVIMWISSYLILLALGVPFQSVISIVIGFLSFVPIAGTVLAFAVGVIFTFILSPARGVIFMFLLFILMLLIRIFLQPLFINEQVMASVGLSVLSEVVCYGIFGVPGALLAVPVALSAKFLIKEAVVWIEEKRNAPKKA